MFDDGYTDFMRMALATYRLATVLSVLTARMTPADAARISARGAAVIVSAMPNHQRDIGFGDLAKMLALLTTRMEADAAAASGVGRLDGPAVRRTAADARNELRSIVGAGGR